MQRGAGLFLMVVMAGTVTVGWQNKARLLAYINPPPSAAHPAETPDVLYTWVDSEGTTHYEQSPGQGQRVEYDGRGITPMAPVQPDLAAKVESAAAAGQAQGGEGLRRLRQEMQDNARRMQEARAAATDL